ncbi:P-loop containing nucleoside triphosphate hydrolase protein [Ramicandelaber brevisporus]|nr:P-loop containing nucleoside triphosphate hydrolase protein [Ramicandelaber brevisporus]
MLSLLSSLISWLRRLFFAEEMELTIVGLQNSGKTTLVNVLASGQFTEESIPTVGFSMRKITKGSITMRLWDIGGQARFRSTWPRYCRGVNAILYVVDSADKNKFALARQELHELMKQQRMQQQQQQPHGEVVGIPLLVLASKNDLDGAVSAQDMIDELRLRDIRDREVCIYSISAKNQVNIDVTLKWLAKHTASQQLKAAAASSPYQYASSSASSSR